MPYYINTQKQYKIWFSTDPNEFLGLENELALIRTRINNPNATLTLVYSRRCLNVGAQKRLARFCKQYNIVPFDFDNEMQPLIKDNSDNTLYLMAQLEISLAMQGPLGNMGVASDFARVLVSLMQHCGIYSDMDVQLKFKKLPNFFKVKAPVIFPVATKTLPQGDFLDINNDFLAGSVNVKNGLLHNDCITRIRQLQNKLIYNYQNFSQKQIASSSELKIQDNLALTDFFATRKNPTLFDFRAYINQLDIIQYLNINFKAINTPEARNLMAQLKRQPPEVYAYYFANQICQKEKLPFDRKYDYVDMSNRFIDRLKNNLLHCTGAPFSGSGNYDMLNDSKYINKPDTSDSIQQLLNCGLLTNNLKQYIHSAQFKDEIEDNLIEMLTSKVPHREIGETGDQSWLPIGMSKKKDREQIMKNAGKRILNNWRLKKSCLGKSLMDLKISGPKKPEIELKFNLKK